MRVLLLVLLLAACSSTKENPPPERVDYWHMDDQYEKKEPDEPKKKPRKKRPQHGIVIKESPRLEKLPPCQHEADNKLTEFLQKADCILETADKPPP